MSLKATVLFSEPQYEIATLLKEKLRNCASAWIITGFATVEGIEIIQQGILTQPEKLKAFIVGAGTYRGFEALDKLLANNVSKNRLFVHLGHSRKTGENAKYPFYRYHPMLHSKIYFMEMIDGQAVAFIGSHNVTGFALLGLNGEASVMLEGSLQDPEIEKIKQHIEFCKSQAISYLPEMKEALTWWSKEFFEGLKAKVNDHNREVEYKPTIVVLTVEITRQLPREGEIIYFELPEELRQLTQIGAEAHVYIFDKKMVSPSDALISLKQAKSFWCQVEGVETKQGGKELYTNWFIDENNLRLVEKTEAFRPKPSIGMQQIRVRVKRQAVESYEYLFGNKGIWEPTFDYKMTNQVSQEDRKILTSLNLIPPEDKEWSLVSGLQFIDSNNRWSEGYKIALESVRPKSGNFILLSEKRRNLSNKK